MSGGAFPPTARIFELVAEIFVDNALAGRLATATVSLLVFASALSSLM
jgi:hypothetical protein